MLNFQQSLGIEFRGHKLRLVHLGKTIGGFKLLNYQQITLPTDDVSNEEYQQAAVAQLKEFIERHKLKLNEVVLGLPPGEVASRLISLPAVEREDLARILEYEVECHLPFTSHEVYLDFQITEKGGDAQKLLLLAARKDRVDQYLALLTQAELNCSAIDFTSLAITNLLHASGMIGNGNKGLSPPSCLLIEVGQAVVEFSLIKGGKLVMARSRPITELGSLIPPKPEPECSPDEVPEISSEVQAGRLVQKIIREIDCWQKSSAGGVDVDEPWVEQVFVMTEKDIGEHICQQLEQQLNIKALIPDNWSIIKPAIDKTDISIELAAGMGLALRGINAYPEAINFLPAMQRRQLKKGGQFVTIGLAALIAVLLMANLVGFFLKDKLALSRLQKQMQALEPQLKVVGELEGQYKALRSQMDSLRSIKPRAITILDVLKEITLKLPSDAWLEQMNMEGNVVEISGRAGSASSLIPLLEGSPLFENVKFAATITSREGEKEKFKIKMMLEGSASIKSPKS